jgi:hypothetical protein
LGNENNDDGTTAKEATATTKATTTDMAISFPFLFFVTIMILPMKVFRVVVAIGSLLSLCHPNSIIASIFYQKKVDMSTK